MISDRREYTVIFHQSEEGGYWAQVPVLPGCYSQGKTMDETMRNIKEAIESHLEALRDDNREIPIEAELVIGGVKVAVG